MRYKLFIAFSICAGGAAAQQRPSTGMWYCLQLPVQLSSKWQLPNDFNYRTLGNSLATLQHLHRSGIKYTATKNWSITAGAAVAFTRTSFTKANTAFAREFRWWQELNYKRELAPQLLAQLRLRAEERSFAATAAKDAYHAFRYRIKPQLQQKIAGKFGIQVADEYMEQHTKGKWAFDQNRLIINSTFALNMHSQLLAGYMWLKWPAGSSQHIATLSLIKNIALHG